MNLKEYIKLDSNNKWYFRVKVIPAASKTDFFSVMGDGTLKIRIKAVPEKWQANKELIRFFSLELSIKEKHIKIISWLIDRIKLIRVDF